MMHLGQLWNLIIAFWPLDMSFFASISYGVIIIWDPGDTQDGVIILCGSILEFNSNRKITYVSINTCVYNSLIILARSIPFWISHSINWILPYEMASPNCFLSGNKNISTSMSINIPTGTKNQSNLGWPLKNNWGYYNGYPDGI